MLEGLPTQQEYEEKYNEKLKESLKLEPGKCGMCARWYPKSTHSRIGMCKYTGALVFRNQEKCFKYHEAKNRKKWDL